MKILIASTSPCHMPTTWASGPNRQVICADDPATAILVIEKVDPDLVIVDGAMLLVLTAIPGRDCQAWRPYVIVMMGSDQGPMADAEAYRLGADHILTKPVQYGEFRAALFLAGERRRQIAAVAALAACQERQA